MKPFLILLTLLSACDCEPPPTSPCEEALRCTTQAVFRDQQWECVVNDHNRAAVDFYCPGWDDPYGEDTRECRELYHDLVFEQVSCVFR